MEIFKKIFSYAEERKYYMIVSIILSAIATILSFVPYYYFWNMLKEITSNGNADTIEKISYIIFLTTLLYALIYLLSLVCSHIFAFRVETNMKKRGIEHLLKASFSFFDVNSSGRTRKIIDDNTANTHTIIAHILPDCVNAILFPIGVIVLSFFADIKIGILVIIVIIFSVLCFKFMNVGSAMMKEYMAALEDINSETVEYVRGIQVIKVFGLTLESFEKLYKSIKKYSVVVNRQCQSCKRPFVLYQCVIMCFSAIIIVITYPLVLKNNNIGEIISLVIFFMSFAGLLNNAFVKIMFFSKNLDFAKDTIYKIENLFENMDKNKLPIGTISEMKEYNIEFENVTFGYEENINILENFNLKLSEGKKYALVGDSGGGKTTIAKLISGFYPVFEGKIKIGGIDIKEYTMDALEKNIAFVFQHSKLFNKSIYENVKIGNPYATEKKVMQALKLAMCESILDKFETREHTVIGAEGVHLSGGEMQRIAIARAILKDAPIIILDEASAASDPENEYEIQQAFTKLMENKTVIMIAHRLSSIRNVDEIIVISDGKILETGSDKELMEQDTHYKYVQNLFEKANDWRVQNEN